MSEEKSWRKRGSMGYEEPLIFEKSTAGQEGFLVVEPEDKSAAKKIVPEKLLRKTELKLPEVGEQEVVRHYSRLSTWNCSVDHGLYPLGSCTMKYNPKINEFTAMLPGFGGLHPESPEEFSQGMLELWYRLENALAEICGMDAVTIQPCAGAQGELTGMLLFRAYFDDRGEKRTKILLPDTAHGTNPASAALAGFEVVEVATQNGLLTPEQIKPHLDSSVAGLMLTNPNTLGLFETHIAKIAELIHSAGGLLYMDGANLNALMGMARPGDMGVDVMQMNLHKTFSTPHGGGGPGSGPVAVKKFLEPFLPNPRVMKDGAKFKLDCARPKSIGRLTGWYGNVLVWVKAFTYILRMGSDGLKLASELAVLNANYIRAKLRGHYQISHPDTCMHECVFSDKGLPNEIITMDVAKRLIDYGFHPPTVYFPLVIHGAIMIEPTETESKQRIDEFIDAMVRIKQEAEQDPELVKGAPHKTPVSRLDEVAAARHPVLCWGGPVSDKK
jgi:glycine dehydrogenase subunit 2